LLLCRKLDNLCFRMLGFESENRLKNLLVAIGDGENRLEGARQRLCSIRDFAPHSAFQRVDRNAAGHVSSHELLDFLKDHNNFDASLGECQRLIDFFDSNNDGRLAFAE
jgi:hypothetical protein